MDTMILLDKIVARSERNPCYGYRPIWAPLRRESYSVNKRRIPRLWKRQKLQVRAQQGKGRRVSDTSENGSSKRRAEHKDHVWKYDFVTGLTENGGTLKRSPIVGAHTRECLSIEVKRPSLRRTW